MNISLHPYSPDQIELLSAFLSRYRQDCPTAKMMPAEYYTYHPVLKESGNAFCVIDNAEQMVGFAPVFPVPVLEDVPADEPHNIWTVLLTDPQTSSRREVHKFLFGAVLQRALEIMVSFPPRRVRLSAEMMDSQRVDIDLLLEKGFSVFERVLAMQRSLAEPISRIVPPPGLEFRASRQESSAEQQVYLDSLNRCFPANPKTSDGLRFQLNSPYWSKGTTCAAYLPQGSLVGSILVMVNEAASRGILDDVFVLPEFRRRGIATSLAGEALLYLKASGIQDAVLEVLATNQPAVSVYRRVGFTVAQEELLLGRFIDDGRSTGLINGGDHEA